MLFCRSALIGGVLLATTTGCGAGTTASGSEAVQLAVQNTVLVPGVNRLGVALMLSGNRPVLNATVRLDVTDAQHNHVESGPLQFIGDNYGSIPVYLGAAAFPTTGAFHLAVHATLRDGSVHEGAADVDVVDHSAQLPVGHSVTEVANRRQRVGADVGGDLSQIDSAVSDGRSSPDPFHDATIQDGLDRHMPMLLYFGEPGRCASLTCGPTVQVLEQVYPRYQGRVLFEHIEVHDPAQGAAFNRVVVSFGLVTEPWVYLVNAQGIVADRFEGPLTADQLSASLDGTLAGHVPAVDVRVNG